LEFEGESMLEMIAPHAVDSCRSNLSEILNGSKRRVLCEVDCLTVAGGSFSAELNAGPFPSEEGMGVEVVIRDVSERKRMEEEVQQSQRLDAIGRVSAGIAHDFNNVLQAIMTPAQLALEDAPKEGTLRDDLTAIVQATREGRVLAKQLLTFARHESVVRGVVDLNGVVTEIEPIARILGGKGLQFNFDLSEEALPVQADSGQLKQIITNLVVNARDALPDGGSLTVSTVSTDTEAELSVPDNGHGMAEEIMD
ncbi:MAG: two-component system sensor histidine kinase NtrB, partial [Longimicrobiales bacterium]